MNPTISSKQSCILVVDFKSWCDLGEEEPRLATINSTPRINKGRVQNLLDPDIYIQIN